MLLMSSKNIKGSYQRNISVLGTPESTCTVIKTSPFTNIMLFLDAYSIQGSYHIYHNIQASLVVGWPLHQMLCRSLGL